MMLPIARSMAVLIFLAIPAAPAFGAQDEPVTDPAKLEQALKICTGNTKTLEQRKRANAACSQVIDSPAAENGAKFTALMTRGIMDQYEWQAQALGDFTDAVALQPDSAAAHYWRGVMLTRVSSSKEDPLEEFDRALALDPEYVDAHLARAQSLFGKGRSDEAHNSYNRAVELAPKNAWPLVARARFLAGSGNSEAAIADLNKAIALEPDNIRALNNRGEIYLEMGRDDLALADFEKAVAIANRTGRSVGDAEKNQAMLLYRRAGAFHDKGDFEQAVRNFSAVMEIMDYSDELVRRGESYYALGKYKEALADFDTSLARTQRRREKLKEESSSGGRSATRAQQLLARITPSKEAVEGRRKTLCQLEGGKDCDASGEAKRDAEANALLQQLIATCTGKDPAKAVEGCSQIIDSTTIKLTKEDRAIVFHRRGLAHLNQNKLRPAFLDFTAALDGSGNPQQVLIDRGRVFIRAKQYDEAIKDLTTALELSPSSGTAYYYRATAYAGSDQIERSVKDFNNALHLLKSTFKGKASAEAHLKKGKEHRKAEKFGSASNDFLRAAFLAETGSPLQVEALDLLGRSYWAGARDELAVMAMSTFLALRPNDAPGYNMRGMSYNELGKSELAIADYNKAMSLDPTQYIWAYFNNRGRAYATMGKLELAVKDYDEALRLKPDYQAAQRNKVEAEAALSKEN